MPSKKSITGKNANRRYNPTRKTIPLYNVSRYGYESSMVDPKNWKEEAQIKQRFEIDPYLKSSHPTSKEKENAFWGEKFRQQNLAMARHVANHGPKGQTMDAETRAKMKDYYYRLQRKANGLTAG